MRTHEQRENDVIELARRPRRRHAHRGLATALIALALTGACSGGNNGSVSVGAGKQRFDPSQLFDSGLDGSLLDGSARGDGASGGTLPDGAPLDAAADDDAGVKAELDPTAACSVAAKYEDYSRPTDIANEGGFSLTIGPVGFGLAFKSKDPTYALNTMPVASAGKFGTSSRVFTNSVFTDVALLWNTQGWRMLWIDNYAGSGEVETIGLDGNLKVRGATMRTTLTNNVLAESRPVLADIAGVPLAAWIASDMGGTQTRISGIRIDGTSKLLDFVPASAGHQPASLALTRVGKASAALAWAEQVADHGVWLQPIDDTGKPSGAPQQMSDKGSAGTSVDLATRDETGGGAVYSVTLGGANREVRFRRLDASGAFMGQDIKIVSAPLQGTDASLARLGGGYIVAYRALPGGTITTAGIRFLIISKEGNVQHDSYGRVISYPLADASGAGGRTTVQVSTDGEILVGFLDGNGNLRMARQRLDCGL